MSRAAKYATAIVVAHLLVNIAHGLAHRELHVVGLDLRRRGRANPAFASDGSRLDSPQATRSDSPVAFDVCVPSIRALSPLPSH